MAVQLKKFIYHGIDKYGSRISGEIAAISKIAAIALLAQRDIFPCKLKRKFDFVFSQSQKIKSQDIIDFTRQLYNLLRSGIPIVKSLTLLRNSSAKFMQQVISNIKIELEIGNKLSEAFAKQSCFNGLFSSLIYIGEQTGTLDAMLLHLINYQEKSASLKKKIKKALFYPLLVVSTAIIVTSIMLIWVIPQFAELYHSFGAQLPLYTKFIIFLSKQCKSYGIKIVLLILFITYGLQVLRKYDYRAAKLYDAALLKLPFFGPTIKKSILTKITLILAITTKSGISLSDALTMIEKITVNLIYKNELYNINQKIIAGQNLATAMQASEYFPERMVQMINIGEESGTLGIMFSKISEFYENEVDYIVHNLSNLLEPSIMVVLGVIIGGLICGMYLPIFRLGTIL
jgi:type IV pilus assembly protein PilC